MSWKLRREQLAGDAEFVEKKLPSKPQFLKRSAPTTSNLVVGDHQQCVFCCQAGTHGDMRNSQETWRKKAGIAATKEVLRLPEERASGG